MTITRLFTHTVARSLPVCLPACMPAYPMQVLVCTNFSTHPHTRVDRVQWIRMPKGAGKRAPMEHDGAGGAVEAGYGEGAAVSGVRPGGGAQSRACEWECCLG